MVDKFFIWLFQILGDIFNILLGAFFFLFSWLFDFLIGCTLIEICLLVLLWVVGNISSSLDCISVEISSMSNDLNEIKWHLVPGYEDDDSEP